MASTEAVTRTVEQLTSAPKVVTLPSGLKVEVMVCKTRHLPILLRLIATIFAPLNIKFSKKPEPGEITAMLDNASFMLEMAAANFPLVIEAVRTLTAFKDEEIEDLDLDDLVAVTDAVIRRNYDFFTLRLLPAIAKYLPAASAPISEEPEKDGTTAVPMESTPAL